MLLIGGPSGSGKSTAARQLGRRLGLPWLPIDDLRLALEFSDIRLPERTDDLYFFLRTPDVWQRPPEALRDAPLAVAEAMAPAVAIVAANHVAIDAPLLIEGDALLPSILDRPLLRDPVTAGAIEAVFLDEPDEGVLLANLAGRSRGPADRPPADLRTEARAKWLHGQRLAADARAAGLPVVAARPWPTLANRILAVCP